MWCASESRVAEEARADARPAASGRSRLEDQDAELADGESLPPAVEGRKAQDRRPERVEASVREACERVGASRHDDVADAVPDEIRGVPSDVAEEEHAVVIVERAEQPPLGDPIVVWSGGWFRTPVGRACRGRGQRSR